MDYKNISNLTTCECGAVSFDYCGKNYSVSKENLALFFPNFPPLDGAPHTVNCNHCVNHWGVDLCGCGSGAYLGECENDLPECFTTAQVIPGLSPAAVHPSSASDTRNNTTLADAINASIQAKAVLVSAVEAMIQKIRTTPVPGVVPLHGGGNAASISLSTVMQGGYVLSAEYYLPESQASLIQQAVNARLKKFSVEYVVETLQNVLDQRAVVISSSGFSNRYPLNDVTVEIIQDTLKGVSI